MSFSKVCCNPLNLNKHNFHFKGLRKVTSNWNTVFSNYIGKYMCDMCRKRISNSGNSGRTSNDTSSESENYFSDSEGNIL